MSLVRIIFVLLSALIAAYGVWRYLPKTLLYAKPGAIRGIFYEGSSLDPAMAEKAQETIDSLTLLGFVPAGIQMEKAPLWSHPLHVLILTSGSGPELACIIPSKRGVTWYFETLFEDGAMVITAGSGFKPVNQGGLYQSVPEDLDAAGLLDRHRDNVAHFVSEGRQPVKRYPPDVIAGTTQAYYSFPAVRHGMRTYGSMNAIPLITFFIPLVIALL
jgi:hypothetical protein